VRRCSTCRGRDQSRRPFWPLRRGARRLVRLADAPRLEKLTTDWVRTTDQERRKQLAEEIQRVALAEVTYVPWGEWFWSTAFRKEVQGLLKFTAPLFWNVKLA
jgi:ABC-type transport system substrate-binding protein